MASDRLQAPPPARRGPAKEEGEKEGSQVAEEVKAEKSAIDAAEAKKWDSALKSHAERVNYLIVK